MRIAYGVHGYGRGHAARALAVLPELTARHQLLLLAGGDAYDALRPEYPVTRIPHMRYHLDRRGKRSIYETIKNNMPAILDLREHGPGCRMVIEALADFAPDVAICDSDAWTHRAARHLGIPRISFDHFGVLVYCRWPMSPRDRVACRIEAMCYRKLLGEPERIVIASFYSPPPRRGGVRVVGPVLRDEVRRVQPTSGQHLLVYFSNGRHHFTPRVRQALSAAGVPVLAYGIGRGGRDGNVDFRPPANRQFLEDLAGCRAVFSTAGNQLISEAIHYGKPMLLLPEDSLEQRLNACAIERLGFGARTSRGSISAGALREFLAAGPRFAENLGRAPLGDGRREAVEAIESFAAELAAGAGGMRMVTKT